MYKSEVRPLTAAVCPSSLSEIESQFMPWLMDAVEQRIDRAELARRILDGPCGALPCCGISCVDSVAA
jgi:hypothetical protein